MWQIAQFFVGKGLEMGIWVLRAVLRVDNARPGALLQFLKVLAGRWSISLFHYRNHAAAHARILADYSFHNVFAVSSGSVNSGTDCRLRACQRRCAGRSIHD